MLLMLKENLVSLQHSVADICARCGRDPQEVLIVGVTKYSDASAVNEALAAGLKDIAENRVQAAKDKFEQVNCTGITKHLIGHLQTNKVKDAVQLFDLIQSVDSVKLVQEINKRAVEMGKVQDILLQVDIAKEEQKFGLPEEAMPAFLEAVKVLSHVHMRGLMTMAPLTQDKSAVRSVFHRCRQLFDSLRPLEGNIQMKILSMGMSGDYGIALEEGATMIRIGSLIFK